MLLLEHFSLTVHFAKKCVLLASPKTIFLHLPTENIVCASVAPRIWQMGGRHNWSLGSWGPPTNFYGFHIKNTHFNTLFTEKGHAVSAVTMDNAKIFSQLMSKSAQAWLKQKEVATMIGLRNYRLKVRF